MINDLEQTNDSSLADDEIASLMKTMADILLPALPVGAYTGKHLPEALRG